MKTLNKENLSKELYKEFNEEFVENHESHKKRMDAVNSMLKELGEIKDFKPIDYSYNEYCNVFLSSIDVFINEYPDDFFDEPDITEEEIDKHIDKIPEFQKLNEEDNIDDLMRDEVYKANKANKMIVKTRRAIEEIGGKILQHLLIKKIPKELIKPGQSLMDMVDQA